MKITAITAQSRDHDRVNISIDGKYRLSLDVLQVTELGIKVGREIDEDELAELEQESQFGKLYTRALEYCMMRPHSIKEVRDYLYRKTLTKRYKSKKTGELKERQGVSQSIADRVLARLVDKGYLNDDDFTRYWLENRSLAKGASRRKLVAELRAKGVDQSIIDGQLSQSQRSDEEEIQKILLKKRSRYPDERKLVAYLARQGFSYDDIKSALSD
ncbi:MAG TPA: RecX family transcriptional regulator [Candidatus Saccharimonadales bacterium]|nr:RecX family transcriptional regulator [Candidatus Saccharimonadales bacterium]